jgi:hypothetical protein
MNRDEFGLDGIGSQVELGKGGPLLQNSSGAIEARNAANNAYAVVRGATAVASDDLMPLGQPQPVVICSFYSGKPALNAITVLYVASAFRVILPVNLTNSQAKAQVASTGMPIFTIYVNGVSKGTCTFTASAVGVYAFGNPVTLVQGDIIKFVCTATDTTLADIGFSVAGTR